MAKNVLITGMAGFIGSHVVEALPKKHFNIYGFDNYSTGHINNLYDCQKKVDELFEADICDIPAVHAAFSKYKPDVVIHLAAQPSLLVSLKQPEYDALVNIVGTINIAKACLSYGVEKMIFASTSAVTSDSVVSEVSSLLDHELPDNPYGLSKRFAEDYIRQILPYKSVILRLANVYGQRQVPLGENQLIPRLIRHVLYDEPFEVYGDGTQTRDYIYVKDVAKLIALIAKEPIQTRLAINVATGTMTSVLDVAETLFDIAGVQKTLTKGDARDNRQSVKMIVNNAQIKYGWKAKTDLRTGIEKTWNWWKHEDSKSTHSRESNPRNTESN